MRRIPARRFSRRLRLEQLERREVLSVTFVEKELDWEAYNVDLGDLDGDDDLDILAGTEVWLNDGRAGFVKSGENLAGGVLGDLDGDGDPDAFALRGVWLIDGHGFTNELRICEATPTATASSINSTSS